MGLFKKKKDPIREREEKLRSQLASVRARIRKLNAEVEKRPPDAAAAKEPGPAHSGNAQGTRTPSTGHFEPAGRKTSNNNPFDAPTNPAHFNDSGVAKYDLVGNLRKWWRGWRNRRSRNPQLVTYLAAGSIQGLPALRHEKRVARNRFLLLCAVAILIFWGIFYWISRNPAS